MIEQLTLTVAISVILITGFALYGFIFGEKAKVRRHPQSEIVNDTSYNIAEVESEKLEDENLVIDHLEEKKNSDSRPLNRKDFYNYKKKVSNG